MFITRSVLSDPAAFQQPAVKTSVRGRSLSHCHAMKRDASSRVTASGSVRSLRGPRDQGSRGTLLPEDVGGAEAGSAGEGHPPLTSCCAAQFRTGRDRYPGAGDP